MIIKVKDQSQSATQVAPPQTGTRILSHGEGLLSYQCRLASTVEEIQEAQRLRFTVFNLELAEGLPQSYLTGRDEDPYDAVCDHLLVEETKSHQIVGTYRLQTGKMAAAGLGFYSAQEFDFTPYEAMRHEMIELGRACVDQNHRNLLVLGLLWRGITDYAKSRHGRYLIGCSSLTSQDPQVGATAYANLQRRYLVAPHLRTCPLPETACPLDALTDKPPTIPKLLRAYLSTGAKICGPPAIDREFKTIDFLTIIDLCSLPESIYQRYLAGGS